jgi:hypothetical protein
VRKGELAGIVKASESALRLAGGSGQLLAPVFTIRDQQMRAFEPVVLEAFVERTVARIAREHAAQCAAMGPDATRAVVRRGIARAKTYAIEETGAVGAFIDAMITVHPEFEKQEGMEDILETLLDHELSDEARMQLVSERLVAAWQAE